MAGRIDARLAALGITLPSAQPTRVARILPATIVGDLLFVSGQITQWEGALRYVGKVGDAFDLAAAQDAARLSALNVLAQARAALDGDLDRIARVVNLRGFVNAVPDFTEISAVVNGASDLMVEVFGDAGWHARTAVGVAVMPFDVALEVEALFAVRRP